MSKILQPSEHELAVRQCVERHFDAIHSFAEKVVASFQLQASNISVPESDCHEAEFREAWRSIQGRVPKNNRDVFLAGFNAGKTSERWRTHRKLGAWDTKMCEFVMRIIK